MSGDTGNRRHASRSRVNVEAGKSYWWCACGRSKKQPFCDGSHKGSAFSPRRIQGREQTEEVCVLRLQAHRQEADVRRQPQEACDVMPDLLLEFFSEEIPARMQARAAEDLRKLVTDRLVAAGLTYEGAKAFATPRRLALAVAGVPVRQPDVKEERKGPRVGAPEKAIAGFLKAAGLTSIEQAKVQPDKKGDFYVAVIEKPGRPAIEVIAEIVPEVAQGVSRGRSRCAGARARPSPARSTGCGRCIPSSRRSGRRPRSPTSCRSRSTASRRATPPRPPLHGAGADQGAPARRLRDEARSRQGRARCRRGAREMIPTDAKNLAFAQGFELVEDEGLLAEVAGLVEWPVVLMGAFDAELPDNPARR